MFSTSLIRALIRAALLAVLQIGRSAANRSVEFAKLLFFGLGSLSSRSDGRRLRQPERREEVADAIETALAQ